MIAAFFSGDKPKSRNKAAEDVRMAIEGDSLGWREKLRPMVDGLRNGEHPVLPFHWQLEFPEVFDRENGGFDAIVGNPPFAGKNNIISAHRDGYLDWLKTIHEGAHGNADLVAHFFRRAFELLREGGCLRPDRHQHHPPGRHAQHRACARSAKQAGRSTAPGGGSMAGRGRGRRLLSSTSHKDECLVPI